MANLDELEALAAKKADMTPLPEEEDVAEEYRNQDILDAMSLLTKCRKLLDFIGDKDLCKGLTKPVRIVCGDLGESVNEFLDGVGETYDEVEEEG